MARYDPSIFAVNSLADAKRIILTPEIELSSEERWQLETPHVCDLIANQALIEASTLVVDYGCGVGRVARELITRRHCRVVGVDIIANMRALAASYVASDRFLACAPAMLDDLDLRADVVLAIWVLQHVALLDAELSRMRRMLKQGGCLFVVNEGRRRFVPSTSGWINDGLDVRERLGARFHLLAEGNLDPGIVGIEQSERTFWAAYS